MNRQVLLPFVVVLALTLSVRASQQSSDTNDLHLLPDYLRYASLNNAELKAKFEQWKAALEQIPQAKALSDPKFTYGYFIEEVETRVGPQKQKFGIMQVFPWFGKIQARTDMAASKAQVARQRYETTKLALFRQVKVAFYEFAYLATAIDIAKQNLELLQHFEEVARTKYRTATAIHPDIIRVQGAALAVGQTLEALSAVEMSLVSDNAHNVWMGNRIKMKAALDKIKEAEEIEKMREGFEGLSNELIAVVGQFGVYEGKTLYKLNCPMAFNNKGADWLQNG